MNMYEYDDGHHDVRFCSHFQLAKSIFRNRTCLIDPDSPALSGNQTWQRRIPFGNRTRVHKWMHMDVHGGLSREPISVSAYHKYATVKIHEILLTPGAARLLNSVDLRTHLTPVRVIIHTNNCRHLNDLLNVGILMHILAVWYEMVRGGRWLCLVVKASAWHSYWFAMGFSWFPDILPFLAISYHFLPFLVV